MLKFDFKKVVARSIIIVTAPFVAVAMAINIIWLALKPSTKYEDIVKLCSYYEQDR